MSATDQSDVGSPATAQPATALGASRDDRGIARLIADMAVDLTAMVRKEIDLAKAEMTEKAQIAGSGAAIIAAGAFVSLLALCVLVATIVLVLSEWMAPWLAALIVFVLLALGAAALIAGGVRLMQRSAPAKPVETIEHAKQDLEWLRRQVR